MREPPDKLLPINNNPLVPLSNECAQARDSADVRQVHLVCNAIYARHYKPVIKVRKTCSGMDGSGQFNTGGKDANSLFDPTFGQDDSNIEVGCFVCKADPDRWYYYNNNLGGYSHRPGETTGLFIDPANIADGGGGGGGGGSALCSRC